MIPGKVKKGREKNKDWKEKIWGIKKTREVQRGRSQLEGIDPFSPKLYAKCYVYPL